ncbi:DNA-binding SARP family transcriptional activator [Stackebrandtia endophytica]|uniref:DNA-binding SARP family transcriptional activator n=1 Tax=Stackebrandtia endophytica TaxID=1496996 RepID=A0A543B083_9ACTN|nr:BTAD domain-containing putative transcriptional regulator [Stackebrandtia endophytica]TQL78229.1 DNA-binding SARP family transcriptional activator [Stackebrandtia endophytica]
MLIRLIGQVAIVGEDGPVVITAPKLAGVLASLASRPRAPISQRELIERVWGDDPPDTVLSVLHTYITRLRGLLRRAEPALTIDRVSGHGYTLNAPEDRIDIHLIRQLVAEATDPTGTDDDAALKRLRRACELADGPALAGVSGKWAEAFRSGFHRERIGLLTERYRRELSVGRHADIVDDLASIVDTEDTAEPLLALLMLAQYRCGRPTEAVAVFETARVRLQDELGADPSAPLQRLHRRILQRDPDLFPVTDRAVSSSARSVPAQLPADTVAFTGRTTELATLDTLSRSKARLAALVGVGGVGKTALAVHWGHAHRRQFPDGQIYVNLRGYDRDEPVTPMEALGRLLTALGFSGSDIPDDAAAAGDLYRSATADRRLVVVLDNAREAAQVRPLLPGSGCFTIVTSRDRLTGLTVRDDAQLIQVGVLSARQSTALLTRLLADSDPDAAPRLAQLCGNLPLALRIAAARIAESPSADMARYADELAGRDRLELLSIPDDPDSTVVANLDLSFHRLPEAAKALFCRLGTLPGEDFSAELIGAVSKDADSDEEVDRRIRRLVTAHLLEEHHHRRYRMHDLVRLYAAKRSTVDMSEAQRHTLTDAFLDWHYEHGYVTPAEETNVFQAVSVLHDHPRVWRLVMPLHGVVNAGRFPDRVRSLAGNGLRRARLAGDDLGVLKMIRLSASAAYKQGDSAGAIELGGEAIAVAAKLNDNRELAIAYGNQGINIGTAGDLTGSADLLIKAIELLPRTETHALTVYHFALLQDLVKVERLAEAEKHLSALEESCRVSGAPANLARVGISEAALAAARGDFDDALATIDQALTIAQRHEHQMLTFMTMNRKSEILLQSGWPELALHSNDIEQTFARSQKITALLPVALTQRAEILTELSRYREAIELVTELRTEKLANTPFSQPRLHLVRAIAHNGLNEPHAALEFAREAADRYAAMPWPARREEALWAMADAHIRLGDLEAARECLTVADAISSPANNRHRQRRRRTPAVNEAASAS